MIRLLLLVFVISFIGWFQDLVLIDNKLMENFLF